MDDTARKTALRMIPYGLNVMSAEGQVSRIPAGTLNWITLASFEPPMIELQVKADSQIHDITKTARYLALNVLGKDQQGATYTILKPDENKDQRIRREALNSFSTGTSMMDNTHAEDSIFIGEVGYSGVSQERRGHADEVTLFLKDLGENKLRPL